MTPDLWVLLGIALAPFLLVVGLIALAVGTAPLREPDTDLDTSRGTSRG